MNARTSLPLGAAALGCTALLAACAGMGRTGGTPPQLTPARSGTLQSCTDLAEKAARTAWSRAA